MLLETTFCGGSHPCQRYRKTSYNAWDWVLRSTGSSKFRQLEPDGANGEVFVAQSVVGLTACGGVVRRVSFVPYNPEHMRPEPPLRSVVDGHRHPANDLPGRVSRLRTDPSPAHPRPTCCPGHYALPHRHARGPSPDLSGWACGTHLVQFLSAPVVSAMRLPPD